MPELPEVETLRRALDPVLRGARIERVEQRRGDLRFPLPQGFAARLAGRTVRCVARRAKYLLIHLDDHEVLAVHLGMTGRVLIARPGVASAATAPANAFYGPGRDPRHDHLVLTLAGGTTLTYNDARRFGYMTLIGECELTQHAYFAGLGVEPLGRALNAAYLAANARGRRTSLKSLLMDQRVVAGLGNIYVCEALFRARLRPLSAAGRLADRSGKPTPHAVRLVRAIKAVLAEALRCGGSTFRDYQKADGSEGAFQHRFAVYARAGEACRRPGCRGIVRRTARGGRSTFYCPACQR
jgi:formamidopyrimidine-DNA glycosylase